MVIHTPRLCNDVAFLPPTKDKPHPISCRPIIPDSDLDAWDARARLSAAAESIVSQHTHHAFESETQPTPTTYLQRQGEDGEYLDMDDDLRIEPTDLERILSNLATLASSPSALPTIGGVAVGAKSRVGSTPENTLEKSKVLGGNRDTFLGTIANSDGEDMTKEELKKLNIRNVADIEKLKRELRGMAGNRKWRLDLVETPRGREFRGIVESEEDSDGSDGDVEDSEGSKRKEKAGGSGSGNTKGSLDKAAAGKKKGNAARKRKGAKEEPPAEADAEEEGSEETYKEEL
jgi:protein OS-9